MITEDKKLWAAELLRSKYNELGQLPKKSDFDVVTLSRIKAFLGPWPRALEAAGLKEPKAVPASKKRKKSGSAKDQRLNALRKLEKKRINDNEFDSKK